MPPADAPRARLVGADATRALATVAVIAIHAAAWPYAPGTPGKHFYDGVQLVVRFAVPVFVLLTGLVLGYAYPKRPAVGSFLKRRLRRSIVPWLAWVPIYLAFDLWTKQLVVHEVNDVIAWFQAGAGHLYFLIIVPQFYVLFIAWPRRHPWTAAAVAMAVQTILCTVRLYVPMDGYLEQYVTVWYGFLFFPYWIGYFAIGVALGGEPRISHKRIAIAVAAIAAIAGNALLVAKPLGGAVNAGFAEGTGAFLVPWMPLAALPIAALALIAGPSLLAHRPRLSRLTTLISDNSLGIYIIHPIILWEFGYATGAFFLADFLLAIPGFIAFIAIILALSIVATRLLSRTPVAITLGTTRR